MTRTKIGVMIATPVRHWPGPEGLPPFFRAVMEILAALSSSDICPYEFRLAVGRGGLVRARNQSAHEFKKSPCLFLVTLDDDVEDETPEKMADNILRLLSHRKPIVAGLYTTREENGHWVTNFMHEVELQKNGLLQVIETGTGLKCFHRKVFEELDRLIPQLVYTDRDTGERVSAYYQQCVQHTDLRPDGDMLTEDFFLDHLCRHVKIGIFVDTTVKLMHRDGDQLFPLLLPNGQRDWPPIPIDAPAETAASATP